MSMHNDVTACGRWLQPEAVRKTLLPMIDVMVEWPWSTFFQTVRLCAGLHSKVDPDAGVQLRQFSKSTLSSQLAGQHHS